MIQLAGAPTPHVAPTERSVLGLFRSKGASQLMSSPTPATQLDPTVSPAAAIAQATGHGNISPADWDELFHAVQARLENCIDNALDNAPELPLNERHAATKTTILECVDAMRQLHASLTLERQAHQKLNQS